MEEHPNQVVPSTSCNWLNQCEGDSGSNQVVPAATPTSTLVGTARIQTCELQSTALPVQNQGPANSETERASAIEESLQVLSLEEVHSQEVQVVPSDAKSFAKDMNMGMELVESTKNTFLAHEKYMSKLWP